MKHPKNTWLIASWNPVNVKVLWRNMQPSIQEHGGERLRFTINALGYITQYTEPTGLRPIRRIV